MQIAAKSPSALPPYTYAGGYCYGLTPNGFATMLPHSRVDWERGQRAANVAKEFGVDLSVGV